MKLVLEMHSRSQCSEEEGKQIRDRQTETQAEREREMHSHADIQTLRQINIQANRQTVRKADRCTVMPT